MCPESGQRWDLPRKACGGAREQAASCRGAGTPSALPVGQEGSQDSMCAQYSMTPITVYWYCLSSGPPSCWRACLWAGSESVLSAAASPGPERCLAQQELYTCVERMKPSPGVLAGGKELSRTSIHEQLRKAHPWGPLSGIHSSSHCNLPLPFFNLCDLTVYILPS